MSTRIGFLRAVNLGKRTVKMAQLVEIVEGLGYGDAWTFIASGNVVFDATGSSADVESTLEEAFKAAFGFEVTTFVRTPADVQRAVAAKPFPIAAGDTHYLTMLKTRLTAAQRNALEALSNSFDTLVVDRGDVHWRMRGKSTDSPLKAKDWDAIVGMHHSTSRNLTMLRKLAVKLDARK